MIKLFKKTNEFATPYTIKNTLKYSDNKTKASFFIMGLGNILRKQVVKGIMFLGIQLSYILFMIFKGIQFIIGILHYRCYRCFSCDGSRCPAY